MQDTFESESNSFGFSVTYTPGVGITGGSASVSDANSDSTRTNALATITADGELVINVGEQTALIGAGIGSRNDELSLTTQTLITQDLTERERSHSVGLNASFIGGGSSSDTNGNNGAQNHNDNGGANFDVTGVGGSFARAQLDGVTRATIGHGDITVTSQLDSETQDQLAALNRDLDNI